MANKTPIRAVFNDSNVATGLAEFQSGDTIALSHGGLGASLSIGSAGQVLKVNTGGSALEFGSVEAISTDSWEFSQSSTFLQPKHRGQKRSILGVSNVNQRAQSSLLYH